jgi:hypothetical protein
MRIFLLVHEHAVLTLDVAPTTTLEEMRMCLITQHGLPAGRYRFVRGGQELDDVGGFRAVPENARVIVVIALPADDPRYHWPPSPQYLFHERNLPITTEDTAFANLHLPALYDDAVSIWRNPERAQAAIVALKRSPSLIVHYTNFMRNHQGIVASFPHRNAFFPLALLGYVPPVVEVASDAAIEISLLPEGQREACQRLLDMDFEPDAVFSAMKRTAFNETAALALLIAGTTV